MDFKKLLQQLELEYWAELAADPRYQNEFMPSLHNYEEAPTFYDWLTSHGVSRFKLSAHGLGRDDLA